MSRLSKTRSLRYAARMPMTTIMIALAVSGVLQAPPPSLDGLAWMTGCWELTRSGRHVIEQWTPAEGGTMLGMSRSVANGKTTEYEFLLIRPGAHGLDYVAKPSGQAEATFTAERLGPTEVVFENPAHDFPTKIFYKRNGDALTAAVEGPMNGQTRRIEYPYTKAACAASR